MEPPKYASDLKPDRTYGIVLSAKPQVGLGFTIVTASYSSGILAPDPQKDMYEGGILSCGKLQDFQIYRNSILDSFSIMEITVEGELTKEQCGMLVFNCISLR